MKQHLQKNYENDGRAKELYNKAFLAGIMILFGIYALKNYTPEEIDIEDDVYAVY